MTNNMITDERVQGAAAEVDRVAEPFALVLFGASGDLTQRMIMPAIFRLARRGLLSPEFCLIGYARSKMTDDEFRARMRKAVMREAEAGALFDDGVWFASPERPMTALALTDCIVWIMPAQQAQELVRRYPALSLVSATRRWPTCSAPIARPSPPS